MSIPLAPSSRPARSRTLVRLLALFALALALRAATLALRYTDDLRNFETGDYILYEVGAQHILEQGDFSNSLFLPRPPLYPLLVAAVGVERLHVLLADMLAGALLAPVTYALARRFQLSARAATLAGLIVAVDPASLLFSSFLGPEPIANLLLALALLAGLAALQGRPPRSLWLALTAGGLLAASALVRPAAYLLWLVLGSAVLLADRRRWAVVLVFVASAALPVGVWVLHNDRVFANPTFSTVSGFTMLYYRAASVEHLATGREVDDVFMDLTRRVEARLGHDPALADDATRWGYHAATPAMTRALNQVSLEVFTAHPWVYLATIPVGLARMYGLLPDASQFSGAAAVAEILWNTALVVGSTAGLWLAYRRKHWLLFWSVLLVGLYFTGGTLLVKSAGMDTRERSMLTPLMAISSAYALVMVYSLRSRNS